MDPFSRNDNDTDDYVCHQYYHPQIQKSYDLYRNGWYEQYQQKQNYNMAIEYLHQSRQCLIEAMKLEKESDESKKDNETPILFTTLSDDEVEKRNRIFYA